MDKRPLFALVFHMLFVVVALACGSATGATHAIVNAALTRVLACEHTAGSAPDAACATLPQANSDSLHEDEYAWPQLIA